MQVNNWNQARVIFINESKHQITNLEDGLALFSEMARQWNYDTVEATDRGGLLLYNSAHELYFELSKAKARDFYERGTCILKGFTLNVEQGA